MSCVFDVVGTCFDYAAGAEALQERLGDKLAPYGVPSKLLFYAWVTSTERDYSYLSQIKAYKPFAEIMKHTLNRVLFQAGIEDPDSIAGPEDAAYIIKGYHSLRPRPGMDKMMEKLRSAGFDVWCCTDADTRRVKGYFDKAGVEMPLSKISSGDECKAGKPEKAIYDMALERIGAKSGGKPSIFVAAHAWDIAAAKAAGFETAYCTIYEKDACEAVFGKADLVAPDLESLAEGIIEKWGGKL
ncbi:haloacid dehalogenase [Violaceomyces palustris]|uniref:Haloacid dehalogenase n=1 Tax=Violaceomyces palustris TaxID=1673888 RepID=A0ACD0NQP1_9BASI|nr:haloacid dehalogenase [Violaceomyces palustris]